MRDPGQIMWANQHAREWNQRHNAEMATVLYLQRLGYSRDESRRIAANPDGIPMTGHNGGPMLSTEDGRS